MPVLFLGGCVIKAPSAFLLHYIVVGLSVKSITVKWLQSLVFACGWKGALKTVCAAEMKILAVKK